MTDEQLKHLRRCFEESEGMFSAVVDEPELYHRLAGKLTISQEEAKRVVHQALDENHIRWIAFTGFALGGRPS